VAVVCENRFFAELPDPASMPMPVAGNPERSDPPASSTRKGTSWPEQAMGRSRESLRLARWGSRVGGKSPGPRVTRQTKLQTVPVSAALPNGEITLRHGVID
jgi:hypothetical protein